MNELLSVDYVHSLLFTFMQCSVRKQSVLNQQRIYSAVNDSVQKRVPLTAGAGNRQGRKYKWKSGDTVAKRFQSCFL